MDDKTIPSFIVAGIGGILTSLIGGWDQILQILAIFMVADYLTGISKGAKNGELQSAKGYKGLLKKCGIFVAIIIAYQMDLITNVNPPIFRSMAICFYAGNEGLSVVENLAELGVPIPDFMKNVLINIKDKNDSGK